MAILKYSITFLQTPKNITLFRPRSGALRIIPPFPTGPMTFQINLVTESKGQDGYNINIPASSLKKGWNTLTFDKSGISAAVESSDWTAIRRMRFIWFNNSSGSPWNSPSGLSSFSKLPFLRREEEESLLISSCNDLAGISADGCDISLSKCGEKKAASAIIR